MTDGNNLKTEYVTLTKLTPHPRNVRQGDVGAISQSLTEHGQYRPIIVQRSTGQIIAGNHTYKAAKALGWKQVAVNYLDVTDEQALRILLVDNRTNDLATYDDNALTELLASLAATDQTLTGTGFDGDDLDDLLFKANKTLGTMVEGFSAPEAFEKYEASGVRSIVLPYKTEEWEELGEKLSTLRARYGFDSNAAVIAKLIRDQCD